MMKPERFRDSPGVAGTCAESHTDPLDLLIAAGWGDVAQHKLPQDVRDAAERGEMPRRNPHSRRNDWALAAMRRADAAHQEQP